MYREILAIFLSSIVELLISGYFGYTVPKNGQENTILNKLISIWFVMIPVFILYFMVFWMLTMSLDELNEEAFQ